MKAKRLATNYLTKKPVVSRSDTHQLRNGPPVVPPVTLLGGLRYILRLWRPYWLRALLIFFLMTIYLLFKTYVALTGRTLIDSLQANGRVENLGFLLTTLAVGFVVAYGARLRAEWLIAHYSVQILNHLRVRMFTHLQHLSQRFYSRTPIGNILARFASDVAEIERTAGSKLRDTALDLMEILYNFPVIFYLDWRLACLALVMLALMTLLFSRLIPPATAASYQLKGGEASVTNQLQENIRAQAVIRAFGLENQMLNRFEAQIRALQGVGETASFLRARVSLSAKGCLMASRITLIIIGSLLVTGGMMTIGSLIAFLALIELINASVDNLTRNTLPDFIATTGGIQRIQELLQERPDTVDRTDAVAIPRLQRAINVEHVSFSYTGETDNLRAIDMTIPAGNSAALVGPSGSGKSTLLSLLMRAHEATTGAIKFDGVDLRRVQLLSLQQQMGVVFQETYLFDTTIRENIRMARTDASDAEVEEAAKQAEIHEIIMGLPQQYETRVGEGGGWLSGGQRQRIAIARAIIRDPAILILDEATSALDPGAEAAINATLQRLAQNRTVISVTHRLSSVVDVDCIFVLKAGRLVESGAHADLVQQNGVYAELWQKQTGFEISADGRRGVVHAAYLRYIELFESLDMTTLAALADRFSPEYMGEGQVVIQEGERGDKLYLIARGQVEVLVRGEAGAPRRIDTMQDGDHFGEMALLLDEPRNATIRTLTGCLFLTLPKAEFLGLVQTMPAVHAAVDAQIARTQANRDRLQVASGESST
ncbi:MAG: ATP-binding cassette domain-containing protein [Caldilineaceae bacterium]